MRKWSLGILCCSAMATNGFEAGWSQGRTNSQPALKEGELKAAVRSFVQTGTPRFPEPRPLSFIYSFVDLASDGKEQALVLLTGRGWCGTGGCTTLVFTQDGSSYKLISTIPATRVPIRVLEAKSFGWRNLSIWAVGGGIFVGYEELVEFNGHGYSKDASDADEQHPVRKMRGRVVLSSRSKAVTLDP